jgi:hypothetical protein
MLRLSSIILLSGIFLNSLAQNNITFRINLKDMVSRNIFSPSSGDSIIVRGSFEGWNTNDYKLSDNGDNLFSGAFNIKGNSASVIEYKFVILKSTGKDIWESNPNPDNPPHGNRKLILTGNPQVLPVENFHLDDESLADINHKRVFGIQELQDDFKQLRKSLEADHCNLYEYTSKEKFDSLFDHQFGLINRPMQYHEFFQILAPINNNIGCMHSNVWMAGSFWNSGKDNLFPLQIKFIEGYAVVSGYYNDTAQVPIGSIILEINSRPINEIINNLKSSYSSDGLNKQFQFAQTEKRFPMAYARYYGFPEKYIVTYTLPGRKTSEIRELLPAGIKQVRKIVFKNFNYPPLTLKIKEDKSTAILKIPSFIFYDRVEYFTNFLDSSFNEIKNRSVENLILDLRENDGGDPFCSVPLLSCLEKEPVRYFAAEYGRYSDFAKPVPLAENHFTGNLYTLIDKHCGSTNGHFCALLKYNRIGKLVGEEAGSTYKCNARSEEFTLENTKMIVDIARATFSAAVEGMDKTRGIEPDYPVEQTYRDYLTGKDTVMEFTLKLIDAEYR